MLALLGFTMIIVFTYLIMSKRMSPIVALMVIPLLFAVIGGFGKGVGDMMLEGLKQVAPSAAMLLFAILYFGVMIDAGLFDPLIKQLLKIVKGDPLKIVIGTALLSLLVALDGDGTTTYMITVSALLPLYKRLNMSPLVLTTVAMLSLSIMSSMTPWGGPATRAIVALHLDASKFFIPLLPTLIGGALWVVFTGYILGKKERRRLGAIDIEQFELKSSLAFAEDASLTSQEDITQPKKIWINLALTIALMVVLVSGIWSVSVLFMIGFALALMINYPKLEDQKERLMAHAGNALTVAALVFAAGIFTGILSGTKMVDEMASLLIHLVPDSLGSFLPTIVALTSMPFTFVMSNDAYYFGVLPIFAETAASYGIDPMEIARASVLGQPVHLLSPLVASTFLLVGMVGVDLGEHQRFAFKWAVLTSLVLIVLAIVTGALTLF
ncbi:MULTISPECIES: CitMHS family transporter [Priestia]|jgi:citrate-Mg2+:H+ or citrate-Ca2+:H+ symporter, CitMHS family|uniref:CitMHS family transporter n=1 Tax=Priestia TaxID=2800373 RepID=UPI001F4504C4|nr:CitMHS family transporter [Priestia megaterium]MCF8886783.1 CitMHS family transporter [Priestia megaterium]